LPAESTATPAGEDRPVRKLVLAPAGVTLWMAPLVTSSLTNRLSDGPKPRPVAAVTVVNEEMSPFAAPAGAASRSAATRITAASAQQRTTPAHPCAVPRPHRP
jgi:hypothetical protein